MLVKRTMSKNVVSVSVPGNREKVLDLMRKENKAVLPVVKEDTDILVGLVTRSDLINNPDEEQIAMLMTRDLVTVKPGDDVVDAARQMIENNVRRVPVVNDDGELVGIITSFDLVSKALTKMDYEKNRFQKVNKEVMDYELKSGYTMTALSPIINVFLNVGLVAVLVVGAINIKGEETKVGTVMAFTTYFTIILNAMLSITRIFMVFSRSLASLARINHIMNLKEDLKEEEIEVQ